MSFFGKKLSKEEEEELNTESEKVLSQLLPPKKKLSPSDTRKAIREQDFERMVVNALAGESEEGAVAGESEEEAFKKIPKTAKQLREAAAEKRIKERKERENAKAKRAAEKDAAKVNAEKKREDERVKRKAETRALTAALFQPYYDFNFDIENGAGAVAAESYDVNDMMEKEKERLEEIEILKKSHEADLARKVQDALEGKPSGLKRSGIERSRQQFATFANKNPFSQRMEGDDDEFKIGGKKRTIRKKNRKGIKGTRTRATRTRATRTRQRKNRTRTMRKKARKSRNSRK